MKTYALTEKIHSSSWYDQNVEFATKYLLKNINQDNTPRFHSKYILFYRSNQW